MHVLYIPREPTLRVMFNHQHVIHIYTVSFLYFLFAAESPQNCLSFKNKTQNQSRCKFYFHKNKQKVYILTVSCRSFNLYSLPYRYTISTSITLLTYFVSKTTEIISHTFCFWCMYCLNPLFFLIF